MYDISSDFDTLTSHDITVNQESEGEIPMIADDQITLLREQNDALTKTNASLHAQFEEAMRITKQVEEVHQKNRELKSQIREYQSQIDNLNQRMDISTRTIEELNQKLETEKMNAHSSHENDQAIVQKEIQKVKTQSKAQLDNLYEQINQLNSAKEKADLDAKLVNGKISRCMENAQHFFQATFNSFDDLITFLSQTPIIQQPQQVQQAPPPQQQQFSNVPQNFQTEAFREQLQKLGKRIKKERSKLKEQQSIQEDLEATISRMKRDQQDAEKKHQQEIEEMQKKLEQTEEEMNLLDSDQKQQIAQLKSKVKALKAENAKKKQNDTPVSIIQQPVVQQQQSQSLYQQQVELNEKEHQEHIKAMNEMTQKNLEVSKELRGMIMQRDELKAKVQDIENQNQEKDLYIEKVKNEYNVLNVAHKEALADLESVRNALHEREVEADKKEKSKLKHEMANLKSQINNLESSLESQKKQTYELTLSNEQLNGTITQLNQQLFESKKINEEDQKTIDALKDDLASCQHALEDKPTVTPEDIMPASIWRFNDFGAQLSDQIAKIALIPALQPSSKLQTIYKAIYTYYTEMIAQRDSTVQETYEEIQSIKHAMNQFLVNTSIALCIDPITFDDFISKNGSAIITNAIQKLKASSDDSRRVNEQLNSAMRQIYNTFNIMPDADLVEQTSKVRDQLNYQAAVIQKKSKKYHELSSCFKALRKKHETDTEDYTHQIHELTTTVEQLTKSKNELTASNQQYKRDLQSLKIEYRDLKEKNEDQESSMNEKLESMQQSFNQEKQELLQQVQNLSTICNDNNAKSSTSNTENENIIENLKKTIQNQTIQISEKETEIAQMKQNHEDQINQLSQKYEKEKNQLKQTYDKAVKAFTEKSNAQRADVEQMSKNLVEADKKLKQAKSSVAQIKKDNTKIQNEMQQMKEQNERDKKLHESVLKTAVLSAEANYNSKLDEQKTRFENDKRKLFAFTCDTFKQFFNPQENIDERAFKQIIRRARDELTRLSTSDAAIRRLVCAPNHQKTDDAVAQVLMSGA